MNDFLMMKWMDPGNLLWLAVGLVQAKVPLVAATEVQK